MNPQGKSGNDFLMGGGIPSASFKDKPHGYTISGVITQEPELQQQRDFDTNAPLFWEDGSPRLQAQIVVKTDLRDPAIPDDDGTRAFYVKAQMQKAVAAAVRATGATRVEVGGRLSITYAADGERKSAKLNPPKIYTATYVKPDPVSMASEQGNGAADKSADDDNPGVDPQRWAQLSDAEKATLKAAMAG